MRKAPLAILILALLLSQSAAAESTPVSIPYGRSWPISIAVDSARGLVYVDSMSGENPPLGFTFGVISATDHSLIGTFPLHEFPGPIAFNQETGDVYVAGAGNDTIEVFNSTGPIGSLATSGHEVLGMTFDSSASNDIFFTSGKGVFALDPARSELVRNATIPGGPYWLALDPANGMLYVSEYLTRAIAVLNSSTLALSSTITLPSCCAAKIALNPKTQTLFASTGTSGVDIVNVATGKFEKSVQVAQSPQNSTGPIAVDDETNRVYVGSSPGGSILELDGSTGAVLGKFLVQSQAAGLAVDTKTQELYATNYHQVTVFDIARSRSFRVLIIGAAVAVVSIGAIALYALLKRRDEREKTRVQSGYAGG